MRYQPSPFPLTRWSVVLSAQSGEAQDDVQEFFAYSLGCEFFQNIQPEDGRFRNFLLVCLRRWMKDERHRAITVKRQAEVEMQPCMSWRETTFTAPRRPHHRPPARSSPSPHPTPAPPGQADLPAHRG